MESCSLNILKIDNIYRFLDDKESEGHKNGHAGNVTRRVSYDVMRLFFP